MDKGLIKRMKAFLHTIVEGKSAYPIGRFTIKDDHKFTEKLFVT